MNMQDNSDANTQAESLADLELTTEQAEQSRGGVIRRGGGDDDLIGGWGNDWIVGGTGRDS